ncbi:MAG: hypothetical protein Q7T05_04275 [Dehalococcoidia bacterium]|nr:hypothetical protein [Dehalococcoidia bacterium]
MTALYAFLAVLFLVHAIVFIRIYTRNPHRIHLLLTVSGFFHLTLFYAYRAWAYFTHPAVYLDWIGYLRLSGAVMSLIGLPPLLRTLYLKVRSARTARQSRTGENS